MGGKAFANIEPFHYDEIHLATKVTDLLAPCEFALVGSSRIIKPIYNDLDYAVEADDDQWKIIQNRLSGFETRKINEHCVSVNVENRQVDLMQCRSLGYAKQAYHCSTKSKYKGAHRNILLMSMVKVFSMQTHGLESRTRKYLDLYHGLVLLEQTKTPSAKRWKTENRTVICDDFLKSIQEFSHDMTIEDIDSFETVFNHLIKTLHPNVMMTIILEAAEVLQSCDLEIPTEFFINA